MLSLALSLLSASLLALQEPDEDLQRHLADPDPSERRVAAERLAAMGEAIEGWVVAEARRGDPSRQRSLLLASGLLGTPASLDVLERAARRSSRPAQVRTYALFLFGAFHPEAVEDPRRALARASDDFERCCLMAGLLSRSRALDAVALRNELRSRRDPGLAALLRMHDFLGAAKPAPSALSAPPEQPLELSVWLLGSLLPGAQPVPEDWVGSASGQLPALWLVAARRAPARPLTALRQLPPGGEGAGLALSLYELEPEQQQPAFEILAERLAEPQAQAWLWGAAGDLGLALPAPGPNGLQDAEVGGLLRLALVDFERARAKARESLAQARERLASSASIDEAWPAAIVLALGGVEEDRQRLRVVIEGSEGSDRARMLPIWHLASGQLKSSEARAGWLQRWSRTLQAGYLGYLDHEGRRWVAYLLVSGTEAARSRTELQDRFPGLEGPREFSMDDALYPDLAELIFSSLFSLDLP